MRGTNEIEQHNGHNDSRIYWVQKNGNGVRGARKCFSPNYNGFYYAEHNHAHNTFVELDKIEPQRDNISRQLADLPAQMATCECERIEHKSVDFDNLIIGSGFGICLVLAVFARPLLSYAINHGMAHARERKRESAIENR